MGVTSVENPAMADPFWDWLGTHFIRVATYRRHNQWYAIAEDFCLATSGKTEADAYRELARMVEAYLRSCHREGMDYWSSMRRLPRRVKLWHFIRSVCARALKGRAPEGVGEEGRFLLPDVLAGAPKFS